MNDLPTEGIYLHVSSGHQRIQKQHSQSCQYSDIGCLVQLLEPDRRRGVGPKLQCRGFWVPTGEVSENKEAIARQSQSTVE